MIKELTIEQKAKAYDEAIKRAKELLEIGVKDTRDKMVVLSFFPELKESEDERIMKAIYDALRYLETELSWDFVDDVDILDVYAWLEKQKEQKK